MCFLLRVSFIFSIYSPVAPTLLCCCAVFVYYKHHQMSMETLNSYLCESLVAQANLFLFWQWSRRMTKLKNSRRPATKSVASPKRIQTKPSHGWGAGKLSNIARRRYELFCVLSPRDTVPKTNVYLHT